MNIYEVSADLLDLQNRLEMGAEDEDEALELIKLFETTADAFATKVDGYARVMKNLQAEAEAVKAEKNRLAARQKAIENGIERLKKAVYDNMVLLDIPKIKTSIGAYSRAQNPWRAEVVDVDEIPEEYLIPQPPIVDKNKLLQDFKDSGQMPINGVSFTRSEGLRFR